MPGERKSKAVKTEDHASKISFAQPRAKSSNSVGYGGRQSVQWRSSKGFKMPKYQNSYRLEPYLPFRYEESDRILEQIMTQNLKDKAYDSDACAILSQEIATDVRDRLYRLSYDRVKYAVMITIIENTGQSFECSHGRLWDYSRDTYSTFVYESHSMIAIGLAMILYYE